MPNRYLDTHRDVVVAAARNHLEPVCRLVLEQDHGVLKPQDPVHSTEDDLEDAIQIERGGNLAGDLLNDPDFVALPGQLAVEPVNDLLVLGDLLFDLYRGVLLCSHWMPHSPVVVPLATPSFASGRRSPTFFVAEMTR